MERRARDEFLHNHTGAMTLVTHSLAASGADLYGWFCSRTLILVLGTFLYILLIRSARKVSHPARVVG
jgi:hypothetical protein